MLILLCRWREDTPVPRCNVERQFTTARRLFHFVLTLFLLRSRFFDFVLLRIVSCGSVSSPFVFFGSTCVYSPRHDTRVDIHEFAAMLPPPLSFGRLGECDDDACR